MGIHKPDTSFNSISTKGDITDDATGLTVYDSSNGTVSVGVLKSVLDTSDNVEDAHLDNATKDPGTTTGITPGFGTWTTGDANRPVWLELEIFASTDGTTDGQVDVEVDESGGTTADYAFSTVAPAGVGGSETQHLKVYVPAGAQFRINNVADPSLANAINVVRKVTA